MDKRGGRKTRGRKNFFLERNRGIIVRENRESRETITRLSALFTGFTLQQGRQN